MQDVDFSTRKECVKKDTAELEIVQKDTRDHVEITSFQSLVDLARIACSVTFFIVKIVTTSSL